MVGEYIYLIHGGQHVTFIKCPFCGHLTYVEGKQKPVKIYRCYGCDTLFRSP